MTIRIKEAIQSNPSIALSFMVKGLLHHSKRKLFRVEMGTFGSKLNGVCYGCAATCAIQEIAGKCVTPSTVEERWKLGFCENELHSFEKALDAARCGCLYDLFEFCGLDYKLAGSYNWKFRFRLTNDNWASQLVEVRKVIRQLKKDGY